MGPTEDTEYQVRDGERAIVFTGRRLARVTSHAQDKPRWIELALYLTQAQTYVLHGCGRTTLEGEVDRNWVQLADDPEGIIDRLYLFNDLGAKYMPNTSRRLLEVASLHDTRLKAAFTTQHVA